MPAVSTSRRGLAGVIIAALLTTGCQTLGDARPVIGRADLVNDLATRLGRSAQLTYTADYRLAGGQSASIAQAPPRTTYTFPGGSLTVTAEATIECDTDGEPVTCTVEPPPGLATPAPMALFDRAKQEGLVAPPLAVGLLTATALDANTVVEQRDTTIAGRHATCVSVRRLSNAAASAFDLCVTTEGLLGSFVGVVDGVGTELMLTQYRNAVEQGAFEPPAGAKVTDRRPTAR